MGVITVIRERRIRIAIGFLALLLLTVSLLYLNRVNDPIYQGKRLSEHLLGFEDCLLSIGGGIVTGELRDFPAPRVSLQSAPPIALEAISAVGTNALPMLVRMLGARDSRLDFLYNSLTEKYAPLRKVLPKPIPAWTRQIGAMAAFSKLGPRAASVAPRIAPLLNDSECALPAAFALMAVRPERQQDILSLTNVFGLHQLPSQFGQRNCLQSFAIIALSTFGPKASGAVPILMKTAASPDERVRAASAVALTRIGTPPEEVIPLILKSVPKSSPPPRPLPRFRAPVRLHESRSTT